MDSINNQQPEDNFENLEGSEALEKIKEMTHKSSSCFFCTNSGQDKSFATRPMSVQQLDEDGNFWFLSAIDSHKNQELKGNSTVQLLFQGSDYSDFMHIYGTASISQDKQKIRELWQPILKTWFTDGIDDDRISVIKVVPIEGYYWDTKHNMAIGLLKRAAGAIIGKTLDDSIEGKLRI